MPFSPHSLPYKLRALFDANVCSPQDIARATGISLVAIDRILRGAVPSAQTKHAIDQALSVYTRRATRHLKLEEPATDSTDRQEYTRGVKWDLDCYDGTQGLSIRNSEGKRIFHCTMPAGTDAEPLIGFLEWWLDVLAPTQLTVTRPSSGGAS